MIRLSIRRPVAITMIYGGVAALGAFAWRNVPIELIPDASLPRLTVTGFWAGASPETVEAFLTSPLEATVQQVKGVEKITSTSTQTPAGGATSIQIDFGRDVDMDFARLDVSERISTLQEDLPAGVSGVQVSRYMPRELADQQRLFLSYQLTGPYTMEALRAHLDGVVVPSLSELEGVAKVDALGGRARLLEVRVDPQAARALGLSSVDLANRIAALDLVREAGVVREGVREWTVTIANRPASAADVLDAVVATVGGRLVRVRDVAAVSDTYEEPTLLHRIDGRAAVELRVTKEIGTNTVEVADRVKARMGELERLAPYGARYVLLDDESENIKAQFTDLEARAVVAALVIFLVLLGFLRSFASALVVFATIGFSVLITLNLVYFGGFSLNLLTLMGLAMGFGLLVDNCIVVLENVYRRWHAGEDAGRAAEHGSAEVVMPILASTATNLIVFLPFVYMQGEMRAYYVPLAIVVGISQLASLLVGFTFIPALSARLLGCSERRGEGGGATGPGLAAPARPPALRPPSQTRFYAVVVGWTLRHPWVAVSVAAVMFGGAAWLFDRYVTRGVLWGGGFREGETYVSVSITLPRGSSLDRVDELVGFFEAKLATMPEVERYSAEVSASGAVMRVTFPDSLENTYIPLAIKEEMLSYSTTFTGAQVNVQGHGNAFSSSFYGGGGGAPNYRIEVFGYNYEKVREIAEDLGSRFEQMTRIEEVDTNASGGFTRDRATEYAVRIHRDALARYDVTTAELVGRLDAAIGGRAVGRTLKLGGDEVAYSVKFEGNEAADVLALLGTLVTMPDGRQIRLGDVVSVAPRNVIASVLRENQQYRRTVAYEFRGPVRLGDAVRDAVLDRTELPPGYSIAPAAGFGFTPEDRRQIYLVLTISVILIYMVTAAVFESLRLPLCVLLSIPMGLIGIFLTFFYTNATFTREAYVGVIMSGGVVVNNAILLVAHINALRKRAGATLEDAALRGTLERVRPILMTSATTVLGMLPLVLFSGSNDNIWNALAFTLIGGMMSSTLLVLTVTPALYVLFERERARGKAPLPAEAVMAPS